MRLFAALFQIALATLAASTIAEKYEENQYYQYRGPQAPLSSNGMVMDTPEVAHAKAAHMAMHAETMARLKKAQNDYEMEDNRDDMMYMPQMMMEPIMQKRQRQRMLPPVEHEARVMEVPAVSIIILNIIIKIKNNRVAA